jgi:Activator of Hsp90 ATPase homolog 1-like protein
MSNQDFTTTITVDQTPEEAYAAINDVRSWWEGEIEGKTDTLGESFTYRYEDIHRSVQKVTELIPGKKIVWQVTDAQLNFVQDKAEWKGTTIVFDIAKKGDKTEVRFTHVGLVPKFECYDSCSTAWSSIISNGLQNLIANGKAQPSISAL